MIIDLKARCIAVLDRAEEYRVLAIKTEDRGAREAFERIVELHVKIAEELEALLER